MGAVLQAGAFACWKVSASTLRSLAATEAMSPLPQFQASLGASSPANMRIKVIYQLSSLNSSAAALLQNSIMPLALKTVDKFLQVWGEAPAPAPVHALRCAPVPSPAPSPACAPNAR